MRRSWHAGALVVLLCAPVPGAAQGPMPELVVTSCAGVEASEVERVLSVEIASAHLDARVTDDLKIEVQCGGEWIRLTLQQGSGGDYLDRLIPAPATDDPGRERTVALAISQMVMAWSPRTEQEPAAPPGAPPEPEVPQEQEPGPGPAPATASQAAPATGEPAAAGEGAGVPTAEEPATSGGVSLSALWLRAGLRGAGLRQHATAWPGLAVGARIESGAPFEWLVGVELAHAAVGRTSGDVALTGLSAHGGLSWTAAGGAVLSLVTGAEIGFGYMHMSGDPGTGFTSDTLDAATIDFALSVGPRLHLGATALTLLARGGWLLGGTEGLVAGGRPVEPGGPWAGAALELAITP